MNQTCNLICKRWQMWNSGAFKSHTIGGCSHYMRNVASGALQKERSPLVFPSVNDDQSSPGSAVGSLSGTWRISLGLVGKDNSRTSSILEQISGIAREAHIDANHQEGKKKMYTIHNSVALGCRASSQTNPGDSVSPLTWQLQGQWKYARGQMRSAAANGKIRNAEPLLSSDVKVSVAATSTPPLLQFNFNLITSCLRLGCYVWHYR